MNTEKSFLLRHGKKFFTRTRSTRPINAVRLEAIGTRNYFHPEIRPGEQWFSNLDPDDNLAEILAKCGHTKYRVGEQAYNKQGQKITGLRLVPVFVPLRNTRANNPAKTAKILDSIHEQVRDHYLGSEDSEAAQLIIQETVRKLEADD